MPSHLGRRCAFPCCIMLIGLLAASPALAVDRFGQAYVAGFGGLTFGEDVDVHKLEDEPAGDMELSVDDGYMIGAAVGAHLTPVRFEAEISYRDNDVDTINAMDVQVIEGSLESVSGMVNGYVDIPVQERVDLYIGLGVGAAHVELDGTSRAFVSAVPANGTATVLAYQGIVGAAVHLNEDVSLTAGYRIWMTNDLDLEVIETGELMYHGLEVGIRWSF